ncbi:MAG: hypothetical protein OEY89_16580, partial [Gammaproteobacteria bacterium]|nr:hypothetical protein [Gammaproteobacteria bacterium]
NMDFNSIRIFLERIWYQEASNKGGGGGGRGGHVDIEKLRYGFVDLKNGIRVRVPDIYESHGVKSTRVITRPVTEDVDEWLEAGLPLEELFDEEIVVIDEYEEHEPPSSRVIRTMCQKNYLSTQNNNLPYASGDLTGKNVHHIYNRCITKIQESLELINNNEMEITHEMMVKLEVPIIVLVTLLTGSDYVDVKNLSKLSSSNAQYSKLAYLEDRGLWRIKMDFPKKKIKISLLQKSISEEMTDLLELPDYFGIGQYLDKLKAYYLKYDEQKKYQRKTGKNKYFRIQEKKSKKLIREFLIKIFPDEDISIAKVKGYLFKRITVNTGGDTVVAMLITRRKHYTGQTQLYYSMPTLAYLQEVYSDAVSSIATINDIKNNNRLISQHIYAGNRVLPSTESINQLLMCVKAKLYAHRGSNSLSNFIVFHNEYTLYTLLMLLYATGYRAVIEPWIEPDEIDRHGFVVISDKGRKDHYSERLVWVPKVLRDQLESYHLHCCLVKMELASLTELDITHINEITEKMFFLDKISMEPISIRPRTWSAYVEDRFPVAMNVGRHYLRTRLMMDRCPPDIINTFMGHHVNGTEPWGTKSTLSPLGYKKEIEVYIEEVMDTLGFEKISGWMRK